MILHSYLTFNGNCRQAMNFYRDCLGGELFFQTVGETPLSEKMTQKMKEYILHSSLTNDQLTLMATDMVPESGLIKGNSVSLALTCKSEEEIRMIYEKLSYGGVATHPLEVSFFGAIMGGLTDRFGINWIFHYDAKQNG